MSDEWLNDHVMVLEQTISRLKAEATTRACELIERYSRMLADAKLELVRRHDDD